MAQVARAIVDGMRSAFPHECELNLYRSLNPDLATLSDDELLLHWRSFGQSEGRRANSLQTRQEFAALALTVAPSNEVLEVGPFASPLLPDVRYCDVLPTDELRQRAAAIGLDPARVPEIDFVIDPGVGLTALSLRFGAVLSSHVIEHQPDLVAHLRDVADVLKEGGRYFVIVPDYRYCFDHYLVSSRISDVIVAHLEGHSRHTLKSVIEHRVLNVHNNSDRHWRGDHGERLTDAKQRLDKAIEEFKQSRGPNGAYLDVHAWQFTPETFKETVDACRTVFDVPLGVERLYPTRLGSHEFWAILERSRE